MSSFFLLCFILGGLTGSLVQTSKIVIVPMPGISHLLFMKTIALELKGRGHQISILFPRQYSATQKDPLVIFFDVSSDIELPSTHIDIWVEIRNLAPFLIGSCKSMLSDPTLMKELKGYDLIVGESIYPCGAVLAEHLSIPFVFISSGLQMPFIHHRVPESFTSLSFIPSISSHNPSTGLSFFQRVSNLMHKLFWDATWPFVFYSPYDVLLRELSICPRKTILELMNQASLVIIKGSFVFEEAQPLSPDIKLVGPLLIKPAQPLTEELERFMQSSGDQGVLYVSFGAESFEMVLQPDNVQVLANLFAQLPFKVLWKTRGLNDVILGNNTKLFSWVPQNDILGHPKTKLFLTHAGKNSFYEAIYHSVPMVSCPLHRDQIDNACRLESRGLSVRVDITASKDIFRETLSAAIKQVSSDIRYKERLEHLSRILRSRRRTPVQETGDWIEHVLDVKDMSHLKPHGNTMPFYQRYLLDVMAFIIIVVAVVFYILKVFIMLVIKCFKKKSGKEEKAKSQ